MRISDWSSDVCSSDLLNELLGLTLVRLTCAQVWFGPSPRIPENEQCSCNFDSCKEDVVVARAPHKQRSTHYKRPEYASNNISQAVSFIFQDYGEKNQAHSNLQQYLCAKKSGIIH